MEAVWWCSPPCSSGRWFLPVLLLLNVAVTHAAAPTATTAGDEYSLGRYCPSLDACRGGVPNQRCCTSINDAINSGECSCVCKQLKIYNHGHLARDCNAKWCIRCSTCRCAAARDERPYGY